MRVSQNCTYNRSRSPGDPKGPTHSDFVPVSRDLNKVLLPERLGPVSYEVPLSGYFSFTLTLMKVSVHNLTTSYVVPRLRVFIRSRFRTSTPSRHRHPSSVRLCPCTQGTVPTSTVFTSPGCTNGP